MQTSRDVRTYKKEWYEKNKDRINEARRKRAKEKLAIGAEVIKGIIDDSHYCDCGYLFPENGYCRFCGAHARYLE